MQLLPTLLPWLRSHKFMLGTLCSGSVTIFGIYSRDVNDDWWQYAGAGIVGLITFGIMTLLFEQKSQASTAIGIAGMTVGILATIGAGAILTMLLIILFALAGSGH